MKEFMRIMDGFSKFTIDMRLKILAVLATLTLPFFEDLPLADRFFGIKSSLLKSPPLLFLLVIGIIWALARWRRLDLHLLRSPLFLLNLWIVFGVVVNLASSKTLEPETIHTAWLIAVKNVVTHILCSCAAIAVGSVIHDELERSGMLMGFKAIESVVIASLIVVLPYALLELFVYYGHFGSQILQSIEPFFHLRAGADYFGENRVRGFAEEPSYFGLYLVMVWPFLLGRLAQLRGLKFVFTLCLGFALVSFAVGSLSRLAVIALTMQFVAFMMMSLLSRSIRAGSFKRAAALLAIVAGGFVTVQTIYPQVDEAISPRRIYYAFKDGVDGSLNTRFAFMRATIRTGLLNPWTGVGLGLAGAQVQDHVAGSARNLPEFKHWEEKGRNQMVAPSFALLPKYFAETGFPGIFLILFSLAMLNLKVYWLNLPPNLKAVVFTLNFGLLVASWGVDGFQFTGYWLALGLNLGLIRFNRNIEPQETSRTSVST